MKETRFILAVLLLFPLLQIEAQAIYGYVYDTTKGNPLPGATVYLNGTTYGTISDQDGRFLIKTEREIKASLVVSYVGYTSVPINNPYRGEVLEVILKPKIDDLDEVLITRDTWSREKKLREFKRQFLGANRAGELCVILNEDDIDLWFQEANETLKASCDVPIKIRNNLLGYDIDYHLNEFEAKYDSPKRKNPYCRYAYYDGWSHYKNFTTNTEVVSRFKESRKEEYRGSVMHFLRSLVNDNLKEEGFNLYLGNRALIPGRAYELLPRGDRYVLVFKRNFFVEYSAKNERSLVIKKNPKVPMIIFPNGIYIPPKDLLFDGYLAEERIGSTLPKDYKLGL